MIDDALPDAVYSRRWLVTSWPTVRSIALPFLIALVVLPGAACRAHPERPAPAKEVVVWRTIGTWSGHGNTQTESFASETGTLRVRWRTSNESPGGAGRFRLTAHSAISGRPLEQVVEHRGAGGGTGYINQEPRVFYLVVESDHLSWQFAVEEAILGQEIGSGRMGLWYSGCPRSMVGQSPVVD